MIPWSAEWKEQRLRTLELEWHDCEGCDLHQVRKNVVFGEGNPDADILIIGEAPGEQEDKYGKPFYVDPDKPKESGKSGELLDSMLEALDQSRHDLYITNVVGCRPPKNRDPTADERMSCKARLNEIIYIVDPLLVVPAGKYALNALIGGRTWGIERYHGSLFSSPDASAYVRGEANGVEVEGRFFPKTANKMTYRLEYEAVPIFHPAYILRMDTGDSKTMEFDEDGIARQTFADLEMIFEMVNEIKEEHEKLRILLNRSL